MSQGLSEVRKARRAARTQRNRPTLVTSSDALENQTVEESPPQEIHTTSSSANSEAKTTKSRLPNFFSKIGRGSQEKATTQGEEVAAARIARATRNKAIATTSKESQEETKKEETPAAKPVAKQAQPAAPARPTLFKSRHLIGILVYLLLSNFIGTYLTSLLREANMDYLLTKFDFFGQLAEIRLSLVLFIAVLAIILIVLTRFDLIPRFGGSRAAQQGKTAGAQARRTPSAPSEPKQPPPAIKQGVKGTSDKEYLEYRANQRRDKKK